MDMSLRPATPAERLFAYEQRAQISERCGNPGYLWGELDNSGSIFLKSWQTFVRSQNTPEFKAEFNTVLDMLRFDERYGHVLKNRATMTVYCLDHAEGSFRNGFEYAFRADTQGYSYLIRCIPTGEDNHVYIYPYRRDLLDRHMKQAERGIRFITPDGKEKFRVADGDMVRIITSEGANLDCMTRYIDDCHVEIDGSFYHVREFAEWMKERSSKVIPLRPGLPERCYAVLPSGDEIITIKHGEDSYFHTGKYGHDRAHAQAIVDEYNEQINVTKAQAAAMLAGSMFGWEVPAADPKNYDEQGQ
ncbi:MAG: hypothetical protein OSJ58_20195, partial [Dysosmobacter sp.]|nr:hypothetical protein [Dysosmobacter sp.]